MSPDIPSFREIRSQDLRKESAKFNFSKCVVYNQRHQSENSGSQDDIYKNIEGNEGKIRTLLNNFGGGIKLISKIIIVFIKLTIVGGDESTK